MELMRFPLENTHSTWVRWMAGWLGVGGGPVSKFLFFLRGGMYLGGKSGTSQGVWSAAEMDHAILLVRCDAHEPWGVNEKRRQPAI